MIPIGFKRPTFGENHLKSRKINHLTDVHLLMTIVFFVLDCHRARYTFATAMTFCPPQTYMLWDFMYVPCIFCFPGLHKLQPRILDSFQILHMLHRSMWCASSNPIFFAICYLNWPLSSQYVHAHPMVLSHSDTSTAWNIPWFNGCSLEDLGYGIL